MIGRIYFVKVDFYDFNGYYIKAQDSLVIEKYQDTTSLCECISDIDKDIKVVSLEMLNKCCYFLSEPKCESSQPQLQISPAIKNWLLTLPKQD